MSCSIIYFFMFAFTVSFTVIFHVASVSLPRVSECPEKTAVIQVIVLVQANHLWVKYLFFRIWCSVGLCLEAVPSRYTTGLQGISEGIVSAFSSWKPTKWKSYLSSLIIFFLSRFKKTYCFQLFHFLKFTDYLLKLNKCKRFFRI